MNVAQAEQINGWMRESELRFLAERASYAKRIVEVGSFEGRSTRAMADNTKGTVYAIDPWSDLGYEDNTRDLACHEYRKGRGEEIYKTFQKNLEDHIKSGRVVVHRTEFHRFDINSPDMIFIDACHEYSKVARDIHHAIVLLLHDGGLLCGHDYSDHWPEVRRAVNDIFGKDIKTTETIWWIEL